MDVRGLVLVGTRTSHAEAMREPVQDVLGLSPAGGEHVTAPDGQPYELVERR